MHAAITRTFLLNPDSRPQKPGWNTWKPRKRDIFEYFCPGNIEACLPHIWKRYSADTRKPVYAKNDLDGILEALGVLEQMTSPSRYKKPNALIGDKDA